MTSPAGLTRSELARVRAAAAILLPGSIDSPRPSALLDFDHMVQQAALAIGGDRTALAAAIEALPAEPSWDGLAELARLEPASFDLVSIVVVGAYFMSPTVLASLHLPSAARRPARPEQIVDELGTGILDAVYERGCPVRTLADVNAKAGSA